MPIDLSRFADRSMAVMGLARSGLAAAEGLVRGGGEVLAWDDAPARREAAAERGVPLADLTRADFSRVSSLVLSPGIPHAHVVPRRARAAGTEIIGDIELLLRAEPAARYVGITGTNGKSTTTALIAHILASAGRNMAVGGNLGTPVLTFEPLGPGALCVLEMSSFQLELTTSLAFEVAILLNITPDHLDRHGGMAGYIEAKRRIFRGGRGTAVIGIDDETSAAVAREVERSARRLVRISSVRRLAEGVCAVDGQLFEDGEAVASLAPFTTLPGTHNRQNAAAAYAAARALGLDREAVIKGLASFPGLAHRQELLGSRGSVRFVNDSKATNADAAAKALACYDAVYWIAGGMPKAGGIESLRDLFPRIAHAFLIGQAAPDFARTLADTTPRVPVTLSGTLEAAVAEAAERARQSGHPGAVVLLSPACASFDQFRDFEARGEAFRTLVEALP